MLQHGGLAGDSLGRSNTSLADLYEKAKGVFTHFSLMVTDIGGSKKSRLLKHPKIVFEEAEIRHTPQYWRCGL